MSSQRNDLDYELQMNSLDRTFEKEKIFRCKKGGGGKAIMHNDPAITK